MEVNSFSWYNEFQFALFSYIKENLFAFEKNDHPFKSTRSFRP